jgi:anti-sigma factor RsiW
MPECERIRDLLPGLADGDLDAEDAALVSGHVAVCPACARESEAMRSISLALRQEPCPDIALPTGAQAAAWILDRERGARPWWASFRFVWAPVAAVGAIAGLVFYTSGGFPGRTAEAPQQTRPAAVEPLPALVISDDEETGRQVLLAPAPAAQARR